MAEEPTNQPVQEEDESRYRDWVRSKYGIEDDPDTYRTKVGEWREAHEREPRWREALNLAQGYIQQAQQRPVEQPHRVQSEVVDEDLLEQEARVNPYRTIKKLHNQSEESRRKELAGMVQLLSAGMARQQQSIVARQEAIARAKDAYPEASDTNSELYKLTAQIYTHEMNDQDRGDYRAPLIATERAAGRLGIPPKSRRTNLREVSDDVNAQTPDRGSRRPRETGENDPKKIKLSDRQQSVMEGMELDPDVYKLAIAKRRSGENYSR